LATAACTIRAAAADRYLQLQQLLPREAHQPAMALTRPALLLLAFVVTATTGDNCCYDARGTHEVLEDGATDCCRLVAPAGDSAMSVRLNCTVLPMHTCYDDSEHKLGRVTGTADPGSCCAACRGFPGCTSWTHTKRERTAGTMEYKCDLYSTVGKTKTDTKSGCSAGFVPGATPAPPAPPQPRNGRPNILFLIVESTDGRTWTPGYSNDAIKLPNLRALQKGGLNFQHHFSNSPVCCPSRSAFWSGRHVSNLEHTHKGYPGIEVPGAINSAFCLPLSLSLTHSLSHTHGPATDASLAVVPAQTMKACPTATISGSIRCC
jgi:hypothetical protein